MARDLMIVATVVALLAGSALAQSDSCQACNCQFNNVQVLNQVIKSTVQDMLRNESGMYVSYIF